MSDIRTFESGANRDTANGKLEYEGYIHPLNDYSFAKYMKTKQIIGGEYRKGDNRTNGIPTSAIFPSLIRHIEVLKLLMKGIRVREYKENGEVRWSVGGCDVQGAEEKNIIQELNAIRFNTEAIKLNYLTNNHHEINIQSEIEKPSEETLYQRLLKERYIIKEASDKERLTSELLRTIYCLAIPIIYNDMSIPVISVTTVLENKSFTELIVPKEKVPESIFVELIGCTCRQEGYYVRDIENIIYNLGQFD